MTLDGQLPLLRVDVTPPANNGSESPEFVEFYERAYPRKQGRGAARKAWNTAIRKATPRIIIFAARRFADDPNRDPEYTPHPSTWLNQERWGDDALPLRNGRRQSKARNVDNVLAHAEELRRRGR